MATDANLTTRNARGKSHHHWTLARVWGGLPGIRLTKLPQQLLNVRTADPHPSLLRCGHDRRPATRHTAPLDYASPIKGLTAPGPPRCEDARTLPTAPASRLVQITQI